MPERNRFFLCEVFPNDDDEDNDDDVDDDNDNDGDDDNDNDDDGEVQGSPVRNQQGSH